MKVMVLDADQRAALAVTRSLGRQGLYVLVADTKAPTLSGSSRYAQESLVYPDIKQNAEAFLEWLDGVVDRYAIDMLLPIAEVSTDVVVRHRKRWPGVVVPFAPIEKIDQVSDKVALFRLASSVGVPVPRSVEIVEDADLTRAQAEIGFPAILKPRRSWVYIDGGWQSTSVRRVNSAQELTQLVATEPGFHCRPFLYQEWVPGRGAGVFALYDRGQPRAWFGHRRLREKPPSGGVSVLSESVVPDERLRRASAQLLEAIGWHGLAMVEYRVDPEGRYWLMEINARFWGSIQLAIDAGVDFPALLAEGETSAASTALKVIEGVRLRWLLGDLDRLWLVWKLSVGASGGWAQALKETLAFGATAFERRTGQEIYRRDDPKPAIYELRRYFSRS